MNVKHALDTQGFVEIQYPKHLTAVVAKAMMAWQRFCDLPQSQKLLLSNKNRRNDFGYMLRQDANAGADHKELFHLNLRDYAELSGRYKRLQVDDGDFLRAGMQLIGVAKPLIMDFVTAVEQEYGLSGLESTINASVDNWTFRFLHYFGGEMLANPHTDRGGFTLHLAETASGGECLGLDRQWRAWPLAGDQTIIFPGMVPQHFSQGAIKALWHRVVGTRLQPGQHRFAIVAFIDADYGYRFDDQNRRTQDLLPGSTYTMSPAAFNSLFVPR